MCGRFILFGFAAIALKNSQECGGKESGRDGDDADADNEDVGGKDPPTGRNGVEIAVTDGGQGAIAHQRESKI